MCVCVCVCVSKEKRKERKKEREKDGEKGRERGNISYRSKNRIIFLSEPPNSDMGTHES